MKAKILRFKKAEKAPQEKPQDEKKSWIPYARKPWTPPASYLLPDLLKDEIFINDGTI